MTAATARTLLFVPGDRPERFDKAAAAGAGLVVLDLEDAVAPEAKDKARDAVAEWLRATTTPAAVRVNAVDSPWHEADLAALSELIGAGRECAVMLPKAQDPSLVAATIEALGADATVVALLETARGILRAEQIASLPGVCRLAIGTYDLATELGVDPDEPAAMAAARGALVLASAAAGLVGPIDGVTGDVRDSERLVADVRRAAALGFAGKLCIHPAQVAPTAATFAPSAEEVAWAQRIVAAAEAAGDGVLLVDGRMVDLPVVDRARRILTITNGGNS